MECRTDELCNLKRNLRFKLHDVINTNEQTVLKSIKDAFEGEDMQTQYSVLGYRIDLHFNNINFKLKLMNQDMLAEILVMELKDKKRQKKKIDRVFIRINPDKKTRYTNTLKIQLKNH